MSVIRLHKTLAFSKKRDKYVRFWTLLVDKSNKLACDKSVLEDFELLTVKVIPSDFPVTDLQQVLVVCKIKAFSLKSPANTGRIKTFYLASMVSKCTV